MGRAHAGDGRDIMLAGIECGIPVVPLSIDAGPRERDHILRDSGADILVESGTVSSIVPSSATRPGGTPPDTLLVLYTSGTTGQPKGVTVGRQTIDSCLDGHKRPRGIVFVDALPRNAMGKVSKARLRDLDGPTIAATTRG